MPFAEMPGGITGRLQRVGDGDVLLGQSIFVGNRNQPMLWLEATIGASDGIDVMPRRVRSRQQTSATRGAITGGSVTGSEHHALLGEPIEVRRLHEVAALIAHVLPAKVIGKDQDNVGAVSGKRKRPMECE